MHAKAHQDKNGETVICSGPSSDPCPENYKCRHLAFYGVCCPQKTEGNMTNFGLYLMEKVEEFSACSKEQAYISAKFQVLSFCRQRREFFVSVS